jgi:hypothetical protein
MEYWLQNMQWYSVFDQGAAVADGWPKTGNHCWKLKSVI